MLAVTTTGVTVKWLEGDFCTLPTHFSKCFLMVYCSFSESLGITMNCVTAASCLKEAGPVHEPPRYHHHRPPHPHHLRLKDRLGRVRDARAAPPTACAAAAGNARSIFIESVRRALERPKNNVGNSLRTWVIPEANAPLLPSVLSLCNRIVKIPETSSRLQQNPARPRSPRVSSVRFLLAPGVKARDRGRSSLQRVTEWTS